MIAPQQGDAQSVTGAQGIDVVAHIADKDKLAEGFQGDKLNGAQ